MRTSVPTWAQARFAALRAIRELAESSDKDIWRLLSSADEIRLPAGACVAQAGRYSTELIVVSDGTLRAVTPHPTTYSNLHHHVLNSSEPSVKVV